MFVFFFVSDSFTLIQKNRLVLAYLAVQAVAIFLPRHFLNLVLLNLFKGLPDDLLHATMLLLQDWLLEVVIGQKATEVKTIIDLTFF